MSSPTVRIPSMRRTLVVLPNWFGETLFALPFLHALRTHVVDGVIMTLGWPQCREVLLHNPIVDQMVDYDERGRCRNPFTTLRLIRALRALRCDTAFILRKSLSRSLLVALAGIPARIGFANAKSGWLLTHRVPMRSSPTLHKAFTYLQLLEAVAGAPTRSVYDYVVSEAERQEASALLRVHRVAEDRPIIVLHPGANWFHKRWRTDGFAAVGDRLAATYQAQIVITGGPDDVALARAIQHSMRTPAVVLAGRTTLRQLGACVERAHVVVANDTGVLHIAAALRRPVVALYGPTSPAFTGPLGDAARLRVLHHPTCCPAIPCYQPDRPAHPGMDAITVDEVYAAACQLLDQRR